MPTDFGHEKLRVYQEAIAFVAWCEEIVQECKGRSAAKKHLDEASTSVVLNIAEGNGKYSSRDRKRYFDIARASALECAACLDVLVAKKRLDPEIIAPGRSRLLGIVSMLFGLSGPPPDTVAEAGVAYGLEDEPGEE